MAEEAIYRNVLENMSDGVVTIDLAGEIVTFNEAAERILGLAREEALGKKFGEVFLLREGSDELSQTVIDAVYDESAAIHDRVVSYKRGDEDVCISVTTSYLREPDGGRGRAVIAVLNDITETRRLQTEQERLADLLKSKHRELQDAFVGLEESNRNLEAAVKKVRMVRYLGLGFVVVFFLAVGLFYLASRPSADVERAAAKGSASAGAPAEQTFAVSPRPISSSISVTGELRPMKTVYVAAPFAGVVKEVYFQYGQTVEKGAPLVQLDTKEVEAKARDAESAYIKAAEKVREMESWEAGNEVAEARRNLAKAQMELDAQKNTLAETERLYKKGIVPGSEYEGAKRQYANAQMSFESAQQSMKTTLSKGVGDNLRIARLELLSARMKLSELEGS